MKTGIPKLTLLLLAGALAIFAQSHDTYQGHDVVANQVILKLNSANAAVLQQVRQLGNSDILRTLESTNGIYLLHSPNANVTALLAVLKAHPNIVYVEPDYVLRTVNTPNDPSFPQEWAMLNTATPGADIAATAAWDVSTGSTANVVGVVDTGIDYTHPDLAPNVWSAPASFTVHLGWGQITCPAGSHGYNAIVHSCDPMDDHYHGTHVSGTIGAAGGNGIGVTGVNWTTRMMGLKFLDSTGSGSTSDAIDAIEFSIQAKAVLGAGANVRVLSNSWGGDSFSQALLDEINKANTNEMLFVAAAGNSAQNTDTNPQYPSSFNAPNIIAVAATTNTDALASFSNFGRNSVSLGAPGVNILSTTPGSSYGYLSGTSMATPHVSGAAMLLLSKCSLNTAGLKSSILSNVDAIPALAGITVTGGRLNVNKALRNCAGVVSTPAGTASFVKSDSTTAGTWKGVYGSDGSDVVGDTAAIPSYVTVAPIGNATYTWAASTSDSRAPQQAASTGRVAECWYTASSFVIDLSFKDANTHQVALYLLDWDQYGGGRTERVDVQDGGTNAVLDTRTVSGFAGGRYLVWNLSGHVILRVTNTNAGSNAVVSGLMFGTGSTSTPTNSASFVKLDTTTSGAWKSAYGADGGNVIGDSANYPAYATVTPSGNSAYTWAASTNDSRAPQRLVSTADRVAACWYSSGSLSLDVKFTDSTPHQMALYLLDWDQYGGGRTERVDILDGATNAVLDTRSAASFAGGQYLVWTLSGHVVIRLTNTNGSSNGVMSGLFFGAGTGTAPPTNSAAFVKTDTSTSGTWKGVYGADGADVIGDSASIPSYATVTPSGNATYIWSTSTADTRAPQKLASTTDRMAGCWYSSSSFSIDVRLSDASSHQFALYVLDWDRYGGGRTERIDVLDGATNAVLDTRTVSGFGNGQYLVWNLSGHVTLRVTNTNGASNAVASAVFFR